MPYIKEELRIACDFLNPTPANPGELNFAISSLIHKYVASKSMSYDTVNAVAGVLSCVEQEFYRTVVAPYENIKAKENGPVSDLDKPFFESPTNAPTPGVDITTLAAAIVGAMKAADTVKVDVAAVAKATVTGRKTKKAVQPVQEATLKPGEARVLQGPIPGDTPAAGRGSAPPRVVAPVSERLPPPGKDATPGEKALYELAEGDDL